MKKLILISFALGFLLIGSLAAATDYYVKNGGDNAKSGLDDTNAWETVLYAVSKINDETIDDGDTVHLKKGSTWNRAVGDYGYLITNNGSSGSGHITIRGDDYGTGAMSKFVRSSGSNMNRMFWVNADYIILRDFEIDMAGPTYGGGGIVIDPYFSENPGAEVDHCQILNIYMHHLYTSGNDYACGISVTGDNHLIEGNIIEDAGASGINHYSEEVNDTTYRYNVVTSNAPSQYLYPDVDGPMQFSPWGDNNIIEYNYFQSNTTTAGGLVILNWNGGGSTSSGNIIRYNWIEGPGTTIYPAGINVMGKSGCSGVQLQNLDIYGNVITGWNHGGFRIADHLCSFAAGSVINFYNNTLYGNAQEADGDTWGEIWLYGSSNFTVNIKNNILVATDDDAACVYVESSWAGTENQDYNLYWHTLNSGDDDEWGFYDEDGTDYYIQSTGGSDVIDFDAEAQNTDPNFTSAGSGDFSLQTGSLGIDNGVDLGSGSGLFGVVKSDWQNQDVSPSDLRDRDSYTPWDIGAYELAGTIGITLTGEGVITTGGAGTIYTTAP